MKINSHQKPILLALGAGAGLLNGLLGAGGGILIVAGLRSVLSTSALDPRRIYPTALAVTLPLSALSIHRYAAAGHLPAKGLSLLIFSAIGGGVCGAFLLKKLPLVLLSRIFSGIVALSGLLMLVR